MAEREERKKAGGHFSGGPTTAQVDVGSERPLFVQDIADHSDTTVGAVVRRVDRGPEKGSHPAPVVFCWCRLRAFTARLKWRPWLGHDPSGPAIEALVHPLSYQHYLLLVLVPFA